MLQQGLRLDRVTRSTRTEREPGVLQVPRGLTVTGPQDWGPGSYRGALLRDPGGAALGRAAEAEANPSIA